MPSQCSSSLLGHKRGYARTTIPTAKWSTPYKDTLKFREALTQIGIDSSKYAGHSFRIGVATTAAQHSIEDSVIQKMGR